MRTPPTGVDRYGFANLEPPIEAVARRHALADRRLVSARWLIGTVLTGAGGAFLIGTALLTALDRHAVRSEAPQMALRNATDAVDDGAGPKRGDRLVRRADIVAERQTFQAPTTVTVGDKQVIRLRGYTRVGTTLTQVPTDQADQVPAFNPLKLLGGDEQSPDQDAPADPGPALDPSEVGFVTQDLAAVDPAAFAPGLTKIDAAAQIAEQIRVAREVGAKAAIALPAQFLLLRASRPTAAAAALPTFAPVGTAENVLPVRRSEPTPETPQMQDRIVVLRHGETIDGDLRSNGATPDQARGIVDALGAKRGEPAVAEGRRLRFQMTSGDNPLLGLRIARLSVYADEQLESTIALTDDGHYVRVDAAGPSHPVARAAQPSGAEEDEEDAGGMRLYDSIYQTALKQQIPAPVITTLVRILSNDIDFQQATQAGDSMDVFYASDESGDGRPDLLFASVTVRNEVYRYYRFQSREDPTPDYFDDAGRSMRKFLIRTPVPSGVFTSGFGMRFHPVLGYSRPHTGVDWAAPVGTPIMAAGNGTVLKAERSSSYGNHIEVQHANGYITTYSHMVGFARGITDGVKVRQGQVIGYLGQTGLATGPHLHYEVIVNGRFVDPMRVKLARSHDITGPEALDFKKEHDRIDTVMASSPNAPVGGLQARVTN